jgi:hypothetical protein
MLVYLGFLVLTYATTERPDYISQALCQFDDLEQLEANAKSTRRLYTKDRKLAERLKLQSQIITAFKYLGDEFPTFTLEHFTDSVNLDLAVSLLSEMKYIVDPDDSKREGLVNEWSSKASEADRRAEGLYQALINQVSEAEEVGNRILGILTDAISSYRYDIANYDNNNESSGALIRDLEDQIDQIKEVMDDVSESIQNCKELLD